MADYTDSKKIQGAVAPIGQLESVWKRLQPLITPDQLRMFHLFGIPLVGRPDPETKKPSIITDEILKMYIEKAVNEVEIDTYTTIMPTQFVQKVPYNRFDWDSFGFIQLENKPIVSVEAFTVQLADQADIFNFPLEWLETGNLVYGQISMIPISWASVNTSLTAGSVSSGSGFPPNGMLFNQMFSKAWIPNLFTIKYTCGFPNGLVPTWINELIGIYAAIRVLSQLAAANARNQTQSLAVDGLSQSINTPGPNLYVLRIKELTEQRDKILKKVRNIYNTNFTITAL